MLTAPQFIYTVIRMKNEKDLTFLPGTCRYCGGKLFRDDRYGPYYADEFHMRVAGLAKDKNSPKMCPACRYIFGNLNNTANENFRENRAGKGGLFKLLPKVNGKAGAVHGIIVSTREGFIQYGNWVEFGKVLCDPPEPPFVAMATEDRGGFLYSVWKTVIAYSRDCYPVCYVKSHKITEKSSVSAAVTAWINREKFARAIFLMAKHKELQKRYDDYQKKCIRSGLKAERIPGVKISESPDWQLAYRCAPESTENLNF